MIVTIDLAGLGGFGQVRETLPEGFAYVASSLPDDQVASADGMLTFTILRDDSFTYTVTASGTEGGHALSGEAVNDVRASASIGGDCLHRGRKHGGHVGRRKRHADGHPRRAVGLLQGQDHRGLRRAVRRTPRLRSAATVDAWDAQGGEIVGFSLDAPSTLTLTLTAEQVAELGGSETLTALHEAGGVMVYASSADGWTALEAEAAFGEDGSVTLTTSITAFGDVAVTLDRALLPSTGGVTLPELADALPRPRGRGDDTHRSPGPQEDPGLAFTSSPVRGGRLRWVSPDTGTHGKQQGGAQTRPSPLFLPLPPSPSYPPPPSAGED